MNRNRFAEWMVVLLTVVALTGTNPSQAADDRAGARNATPDHPWGLVAFASVDRLKARAESLAEALGQAGEGEEFLTKLVDDSEGIRKLITSNGLDTTRPIGAMCFPKWLDAASDPDEESEFDWESVFGDGLASVVEASFTMFTENVTLVLCIPYKDRQQLLDDFSHTLLSEGDQLKPVDDQPGWYQLAEQKDVRIGFAHNYLMLVHDEGKTPQFDRNYPDFAKLARSSLGKNGFVYSLYRKGLPFLIRDVMGPAFKLAFAARFQQQDGESDIQFRMRTMSSALQMQLLDLAISHVDEFRLTGHVDSRTRTILIEPEIIGAKGGKLSKYFNEGKASGSLFTNQPTDDAIFAASVTLPLPAKDWKPTIDALDAFAQSQGKSSQANLARAFAKTIEAGQFELYTYSISWDEGLIALRHNGGVQFPEQLQDALPKLLDRSTFELNVDAVDGIPIHRTLTTLDDSPVFTMLAIPLMGLIGQELQLPDIGETGEEKEVVFNSLREEEQADGTKKIVPHQTKGMVPTGENSLWLAATPRAIFLGFGSSKSGECPDWFKTQIAASLEASPGRGKSPFQVTLRQLGSAAPEIQQVFALEEVDGVTRVKQAGGDAAAVAARAELATKTQENLQGRANLIRDLPNAIRCEFRPTETGAKLSISFQEAYFQWFATMIRDSHEEQEIRSKLPPEQVPAAPVGVDFTVPAQ